MTRHFIKRALMAAAVALPTGTGAAPSFAADTVTISHYFTGELGRKGIEEIFAKFTAATGIAVKDSPIGHEDFKTGILVRAAGNSLPDVFSYWAGARTKFVVDAGNIAPIDAEWAASGLDQIVEPGIVKNASIYGGKHYLVPFGYHYAGVFYNAKVFKDAGITQSPKTWDEFLALCATLKGKGITPIALGSKDQWPAQFWFDYLLLRTAGPDYRAKLMAGAASYTDPEVKTAMLKWKELTDAGYFLPQANASTWTEAADKVAQGKAAMTLMGTWITGYWNGIGLKPGADYDFFPFPTVKAGVPNAVVGPVDGLVMSKTAANKEATWKFIAYLITNTEVQAKWAAVQGALSPNTKVDTKTYSPVMKHALDEVGKADTFAFNYDLATTPPMAEVGLAMFARFMDDPSEIDDYLKDVQAKAKDVFAKAQ
ncbi:MAG: extracellular solute-binding protein [Ancalomicrobiaceae bacterium]|nr:extracellular solute-binding protein [Ancalomicrobiaceae bacterium]